MSKSLLIILISFTVLVLGASLVFPVLLYEKYNGGSLGKATGIGGSGAGCFIPDDFFTNTSIDSASAIAQVTQHWPQAQDKTTYLQQIFDKGKAVGINPLMAVGVWAGEQTFEHPEKAFGYGYTDNHTLDGVSSWDAQLNGVFGALVDAKNGTGLYKNPDSTNMFTRFFFNYTTAMQTVYKDSGNQWVESAHYTDGSTPVAARLAVFHLVAPQEILCQSATRLASGIGNNNVPLIKQASYPQEYGQSGHTIADAGCCVVSATMVLNYYNINTDPVAVANFSYDKHCYIGDGTDTKCLFSKLADQYQLNYVDIGNNWGKAIDYLKQGKPLLAHGTGSSPFTKSGHCIVITGYDSQTKLFNINNPANTGKGPYSQDQLVNAGIVGMFYVGK